MYEQRFPTFRRLQNPEPRTPSRSPTERPIHSPAVIRTEQYLPSRASSTQKDRFPRDWTSSRDGTLHLAHSPDQDRPPNCPIRRVIFRPPGPRFGVEVCVLNEMCSQQARSRSETLVWVGFSSSRGHGCGVTCVRACVCVCVRVCVCVCVCGRDTTDWQCTWAGVHVREKAWAGKKDAVSES
jgi:hypothetical protein